MSDKKVEECFERLKGFGLKDVKKVDSIIEEYCRIESLQLPPLPKMEPTKQELIENKFIPSPELIASYQKNLERTCITKPITENAKLKSSYGEMKVGSNTLASREKFSSATGFNKPCVLVEKKEETILQNLQSKNIEATIPQMQQTLLCHQLSNLRKKDVKIENQSEEKKTGTLSDWKKIREKIALIHNIQ